MQLNLRHFRRGRRRSGAVVAHTGYALHQQDPHEAHRSIPPHANALCHFHIAASINPATGKKCNACYEVNSQFLLGTCSLWKLSRCICRVYDHAKLLVCWVCLCMKGLSTVMKLFE